MLGRLFHEADKRGFARRKTLGEVWVSKPFGNTGKKFLDGGNGRKVGLHTRPPALTLLAEIEVVVEDLRFLIESQTANVDHGTFIRELREIALTKPQPRSLINVLARRQQEAIAVIDRRTQFRKGRGPVLDIIVA